MPLKKEEGRKTETTDPNHEIEQENVYEELDNQNPDMSGNQYYRSISTIEKNAHGKRPNVSSEDLIYDNINVKTVDEASIEITRNPNFIIYENPKSLKTHANGDIYYTEKDGIKQVAFDDETYAVIEKK